jgi:hypothetical protein
MNNAMTQHSDAELLAAFVDGQLDQEQLQAVTAHLAECEECRGVIGEAAAFEQEEQQVRRPRRGAWLAVAAGVVVAVIAYPFVQGALHRRDLRNDEQALFVAEGNTERPIEGRFGGQTAYSKAHRTTRGGNEISSDTELAALELLETAKTDNSPAAIRARALAAAATNFNPTKALTVLNSIPPEKRDAVIWNDLAALQYAANNWAEDPKMLDNALLAAEKALVLHPDMPEALFNYALILQKKGDPHAAGAWNHYLQVDGTGPWAEEARGHLTDLHKPAEPFETPPP